MFFRGARVRLLFLAPFLWSRFLLPAPVSGVASSPVWKEAEELICSAAWQCEVDAQVRIEKLLTELGPAAELLLKQFLDRETLNAREYSLALYAAALLTRFGTAESLPFLRERCRRGYRLTFPVPILKSLPEALNLPGPANSGNVYYQHLLKMALTSCLVRLGDPGKKEHLAFLQEMTRHPEAEWAAAAMVALGQTGTEEAVSILSSLLQEPRVKDNGLLMEGCLVGLGESSQAAAVPVLAGVVKKACQPVRWRDLACAGLGKIGAAFTVPVILDFCRNCSETEQAEGALQRMGKGATGYLTEVLSIDPPSCVRRWASLAGKMGLPEMMPSLMAAWEKMDLKDGETGPVLVEAMLKLAPEETRVFLEKKLLSAEEPAVIKAASSAGGARVSALKPVLVQVLASQENVRVRQAVTGALARIAGSDDVVYLKKLLADQDESVRTMALAALSNNEEGVSFLLQYLASSASPGWEKGLRILGTSRNRQVMPLLAHFLSHGEEKERLVAALAAGDSGSWEMVEPLLARLVEDDSLQVKRAVLYSLEQIFLANRPFLRERSQSILAILLSVSRHQEPDFRVRSALLLGRLGQPAALNRLLEMVDDGEAEVRKAVAMALAGYSGDKVFRALSRLGNDSDAAVRRQAGESLKLFFP